MSQPTDGMIGPGYLSEEPLSDNAAAPVVSSDLTGATGSRRGTLRSAHQLEPLMFALQIERRIRAHLQRILGSHQEVSDLMQDVYLQLLIASDRPSHTVESTTAFVMTVARNKAYDWLRRKKIATRLCPTIDIDDVEIPADDMGPDELVSSERELESLDTVDAMNALVNVSRQPGDTQSAGPLSPSTRRRADLKVHGPGSTLQRAPDVLSLRNPV